MCRSVTYVQIVNRFGDVELVHGADDDGGRREEEEEDEEREIQQQATHPPAPTPYGQILPDEKELNDFFN